MEGNRGRALSGTRLRKFSGPNAFAPRPSDSTSALRAAPSSLGSLYKVAIATSSLEHAGCAVLPNPSNMHPQASKMTGQSGR
eukprot:1655604-Pleurochrysis_carterae.AAC.1